MRMSLADARKLALRCLQQAEERRDKFAQEEADRQRFLNHVIVSAATVKRWPRWKKNILRGTVVNSAHVAAKPQRADSV